MIQNMGLSKLLKHMLDEATQTEQTQTINLQRGLRLHVKIEQGYTTLGISRAEAYPSTQEWATVTRALPYSLEIKPQSGISKAGRFILYAQWPTPTQEQWT